MKPHLPSGESIPGTTVYRVMLRRPVVHSGTVLVDWDSSNTPTNKVGYVVSELGERIPSREVHMLLLCQRTAPHRQTRSSYTHHDMQPKLDFHQLETGRCGPEYIAPWNYLGMASRKTQ